LSGYNLYWWYQLWNRFTSIDVVYYTSPIILPCNKLIHYLTFSNRSAMLLRCSKTYSKDNKNSNSWPMTFNWAVHCLTSIRWQPGTQLICRWEGLEKYLFCIEFNNLHWSVCWSLCLAICQFVTHWSTVCAYKYA